MSGLSAVLFDLDGTLLDRRATFERHLEKMMERHPGLFGAPDDGLLQGLVELDRNGFEDRRVFYGRIEESLSMPEGSGATLHAYFEEHFPEECVPMPNLEGTLDALIARGYRLGLITNGRASIQGRKLVGLGIRGRFDTEVISEVVGVRKPDPKIFGVALDAMGISPHEAAYVGDNPAPDIVGANRSGLMAIWRRDGVFEPPKTAELVIDDLSELLDHFSAADGAAGTAPQARWGARDE